MITWPLESNVIRKGKINNTFGMVRNNGTKAHQGWDFFGVAGVTPVFAVGSGNVQFVDNVDDSDYGKTVCHSFEHGGKTYYAFYAHLHSINVSPGSSVAINQVIGVLGSTGNASNLTGDEVHLHFEIRTQIYAPLGLSGRVSPYALYKHCPLQAPADGNQMFE